MRREYELTEEQLETIYDACKPVTCMMIGNSLPRNPQENANDAWRAMGVELGFEYMTVEPVPGKGDRFFTAEEAAEATP